MSRFDEEFYVTAKAMKANPGCEGFFEFLEQWLQDIRTENDMLIGERLHWGQGKAQLLQELLNECDSAEGAVKNFAKNLEETGPSVSAIT